MGPNMKEDTMDLETGSNNKTTKTILENCFDIGRLAYQSLGVVYGALSTSPLYVFTSTFNEDIEHSKTNEEIYGVLSLVIWTLTLIPLIKYVFLVLRADDNGEGGTFALYSLLCTHARVSSLPICQLADEKLSSDRKEISTRNDQNNLMGSRLKLTLEKHRVLQKTLLILSLIGACMVIGDVILSPAISGKSMSSSMLSRLGYVMRTWRLSKYDTWLHVFFYVIRTWVCVSGMGVDPNIILGKIIS